MNKAIFFLVVFASLTLLANSQANSGSLFPDAYAAVDYFLKIEGVGGESKDSKHKGWIDVESFSFGVSNTGSGAGGGAGKAKFNEIVITKTTDKSSPVLLVESASGKHFTGAEIEVVRDGTVAMKWKLKDVVISSYQVGSGEEIPIEMVSLNLASVEVTYGSVSAGWDLKANKRIGGTTSTGTEPAKTAQPKKETTTPTTPTTPTPSTQPATRAPADSDGDGIADDKDKCVSEAETKNSYQDDDGCPDRTPATTTVPKTVTPIIPKTVTPLK